MYRQVHIYMYIYTSQNHDHFPSTAFTRAEAEASAGDTVWKSVCGMPSGAGFQKGVVSLIQVLPDQISRMALGVT